MMLRVIIVLCLVCTCTHARSLKRSAGDIHTACSKTTPCGWEIYKPYVRTVEYFVKSPCDCPNGTHCKRTDDDISISAFVHRCRTLGEGGQGLP